MNNLIQSISAYVSTLEQQLAALEARVAKMEEAHEAMKREGEEANALIASLQAEIEALKTTGIAPSVESAEPEIEIELLMDDEEELEEKVEEATKKQSVLEVVEAVEVEEIPEILDSPVVLEEELAPVVEEEPEVVAVEEPQIEPVVEPEKPVEPAPRAVPQQTSLFGSAVSDIRQAISLGDRFLFQRELFAGNGELMQKTLDELNTLGSLDEAMEYVQENFEWDMECTAVKLFENVLKRRFN
jgi:outer membrane murein-binding lipoprotein Lpp